MRTVGFTALAFVVGLVVGFAVFVFGAFAWLDYAGVFDRDGGIAMGIFFTLGPIAGMITGVIAAVTTITIRTRRDRAVSAGARPAPQRWPLGVRAVVAAIVWGALSYAVVWCIFWLLSPMSFSTYETALVVSWLPLAVPLAFALCAALFVLVRRAPREIATRP